MRAGAPRAQKATVDPGIGQERRIFDQLKPIIGVGPARQERRHRQEELVDDPAATNEPNSVGPPSVRTSE